MTNVREVLMRAERARIGIIAHLLGSCTDGNLIFSRKTMNVSVGWWTNLVNSANA